MTCKAVLLAGASHTGKSTLATLLGRRPGWPVLSSDTMACNPGRPWPDPRPHVVECFATLSADSLETLLRHHHENVAPLVEMHLDRALQAGPVVLEGSAIRPGLTACPGGAVMIALHLAPEAQAARIAAGSELAQLSGARKAAVEGFLNRSLRDNAAVIRAASKAGTACFDAADHALSEKLRPLIARNGRPFPPGPTGSDAAPVRP